MTGCIRWSVSFVVVLLVGAAAADGATLCVRPGGGGGCLATISLAVAAAAPGDTIQVAQGTYKETVTITRSVSLVGEHSENTIIDATGLPNGIRVGAEGAGASDVTVRGFTIANANFEGIIVIDSSDVTISGNKIAHNNLSLAFPNCPEIPPPDSQAGEGFDCGEGVHLVGVNHSTIASNIIEHNAGGVLLTDETRPTHDNLISANRVVDNPFDCGITLASHVPAEVARNGSGVYHNTIVGNEVSRNGVLGQGAGVGMFTPAPGTATYGNVVIGNRAIGNGLPGVALHSHAPNQNLNDNKIIANYIAANGVDDDAQTPGTTGIVVFGVSPVTGTIISQNVIEREEIAVAVKTSSTVDIHLNDLNNHKVGVANLDGGSVDATENWWGCAHGPGAPGCSTASVGILTTPWLHQPIHP